MNEIVYSHRPAAGVSVAAVKEGSQLVVAFALVNDGTSRNGLMWPERRDAFSRPTARQILNGRLDSARKDLNANVEMTVVFTTDMDARRFMAEFRKGFKPTEDESDSVFCTIDTFSDLEVRYRDGAEQILEKLHMMANEVIAASVPF